MQANKKGRYGGNRSTLTYTSSRNSKSCFCRGQGSCITCAAWARLYRHLQAMRQAALTSNPLEFFCGLDDCINMVFN